MAHITKTPGHQKYDYQLKRIADRVKNWAVQRQIEFTNDWTIIPFSKSKKTVFHLVGDLIPSNDILSNLNKTLLQTERYLLIITDSIASYQFSNIKIISHPALRGIYHLTVDHSSVNYNRRPTKKFNCFMHRVDPGRQSWFYFLHLHGLLDQGYVSFLLYQLPNYGAEGLELFEKNHREYLYTLPKFEKAYKELRDIVPFQNFLENYHLDDKILDSRYSLILDTYAEQDDNGAWFASEKIFRSLMLPTINLIYAQKGAIQTLLDQKFELYADLSTIDNLSWHQRQQKLLEILESDSIEYRPLILKEKAMYNSALLESMFNTMSEFDELVQDILGNPTFCLKNI